MADTRQGRHRQLEAQVEDRRLGQLLLDSGGSDSDFGAAATSTTTKYGKKRFTLQGLKKQQQESLKHVKGQKAHMEQRKEDF